MDRTKRRFLQLGLGSFLSGGALGYWRAWKAKMTTHRADWKPAAITGVASLRTNDLTTYFTEAAMHEALGVSTLGALPRCTTVAYNFPAWHTTPFMEKAIHSGWTEFELLRAAKPLYPSHQMPRYPLWGSFNEADPAWAAREIDAAADHGIDVWMIDWYWHAGTMFYHEQLENGFLQASNTNRLKFAIMWANHDWRNVYPAPPSGPAPLLIAQTHSEDDTLRAIDYCIEHYFHRPNYWRFNNGLVFGIFDVGLMCKLLGFDGLKRTLERLRQRVLKAGLGGTPHPIQSSSRPIGGAVSRSRYRQCHILSRLQCPPR